MAGRNQNVPASPEHRRDTSSQGAEPAADDSIVGRALPEVIRDKQARFTASLGVCCGGINDYARPSTAYWQDTSTSCVSIVSAQSSSTFTFCASSSHPQVDNDKSENIYKFKTSPSFSILQSQLQAAKLLFISRIYIQNTISTSQLQSLHLLQLHQHTASKAPKAPTTHQRHVLEPTQRQAVYLLSAFQPFRHPRS